MTNFLLCTAQYLIIMVVLAAIGVCGALIGIRLRKSRDAKKAAEETAAEINSSEED